MLLRLFNLNNFWNIPLINNPFLYGFRVTGVVFELVAHWMIIKEVTLSSARFSNNGHHRDYRRTKTIFSFFSSRIIALATHTSFRWISLSMPKRHSLPVNARRYRPLMRIAWYSLYKKQLAIMLGRASLSLWSAYKWLVPLLVRVSVTAARRKWCNSSLPASKSPTFHRRQLCTQQQLVSFNYKINCCLVLGYLKRHRIDDWLIRQSKKKSH